MRNVRQLMLGLMTILMTGQQFCLAQLVNPDWKILSENNEPARFTDTVFMGKTCMHLSGKTEAIAMRNGPPLKNFRMELDIAGEVMSGVGFRAIDEQNYHFLYFRPGYGNTREAIQYVPIYNGTLSWVLYNYPIYETTADIKPLTWFHVVLEVRNTNMKVFVNHSPNPQMEINLITSDFNRGGILLRSMFGGSYFANVKVRPLPEVLTDWEVSEQFARSKSLDVSYPMVSKVKSWVSLKPDQADVMNLSKIFKIPDGVAVARHFIPSDEDRDRLLHFDFSGKLKIYMNGKELYHYEKQKLDRIFNGTYVISLPLKKGSNELIFITEGDADFFGKGFNAMGRMQHQNWGFIAEIDPL